MLEDLDSANGIYVNKMPARRAVLGEADFLRIGEMTLKFAGGPFERPLDSGPRRLEQWSAGDVVAPRPAQN